MFLNSGMATLLIFDALVLALVIILFVSVLYNYS